MKCETFQDFTIVEPIAVQQVATICACHWKSLEKANDCYPPSCHCNVEALQAIAERLQFVKEVGEVGTSTGALSNL